MANKALVIDSTTGLPLGESNKWVTLTNMDIFVSKIMTPELKEGANIGSLISGIPSPFARIDLFKAAIDNSTTQGERQGSLNSYYSTLVSEWRGFIAAMALDYTKFSVKRVDLRYHDGNDFSSTDNIYEPLGAFGNMLFERSEIWRDPSSKTPFIDIVKYDGKVVGGTCPETFLFTSVGGSIKEDDGRTWVKDGRFTDPLNQEVSEANLCALYAYVGHILANIGNVSNYFSAINIDLAPQYGNVILNLQQWEKEIKEYADAHGYDLKQSSIPPVDIAFDKPYSFIFNFRDILYGKDGVLTIAPDGDAIIFDPKKALLPKESEIARIALDPIYDNNPERLSELPIFVLKAPKKNDPTKFAHFALPLSALGLNVFGRNIGALAGIKKAGNGIKSALTAIYDEDVAENNLEVTLSLVTTDGKSRIFKESYTVREEKTIIGKDIVIWPNFIAKEWDRYFLYSEMPHNAKSVDHPYRAFPFVADPKTAYSRILVDEESSEPVYLAENGVMVNIMDRNNRKMVESELLVSSDSRCADNPYKYEIYESNLPFKGVRLQSQTGKEGGFLVINYSSDKDSGLPINRSMNDVSLLEAVVGIDFGSTNTSVAYFDSIANKAFPIDFKNRRVSLLASATDGDISKPKPKKVFFFQAAEIRSNGIKSILTLHDPSRLDYSKEGNNVLMMGKEIKGGFPSFANNLPLKDVDEDVINLSFAECGNVQQIHNMKWSRRDIDKAHIRAFLKSLMLQVYAEMFDKGYYPNELKWSYPSSMPESYLISYQNIWNSIKEMSPLEDRGLEVLPPLSEKMDLTGEDPFGAGNNTDPFGGTDDIFSKGNDPFGGGNNADPFGRGNNSDPFGGGGMNPFGNGNDPFDNKTLKVDDNFGNSSDDPWGEKKRTEPSIPDLRPDDDRPREFEPEKLPKNRSLTEACAVASYMIANKNAGLGDGLTLCFDIGGSTTDFSALTRLKQGPTMIKQNSIRFAAKLVADATKYIPEFKDVVVQCCAQFNLTIMGINKGKPAYSPKTAPYYFEQIVDRLTSSQLTEFYRMIAEKCPKLMSVNLYVTGLITFYAGQIAARLIKEVKKSPDCAWTRNPVVSVVFAGKGARLFEWFSTIRQENAQYYYRTMFIEGLGVKDNRDLPKILGGWPVIDLKSMPTDDVKFEVSMGLAASSKDMWVPKDEAVIEIIGETGFSVKAPDGNIIPLESDNSITPEMMRHIGSYFFAPQVSFGGVSCDRFRQFCSIFYKAVTAWLDFRMSPEVFANGFREMNIDGYVQNHPDFSAALQRERDSQGKFDFVAPIIILEGEKFYKDCLLPNL